MKKQSPRGCPLSVKFFKFRTLHLGWATFCLSFNGLAVEPTSDLGVDPVRGVANQPFSNPNPVRDDSNPNPVRDDSAAPAAATGATPRAGAQSQPRMEIRGNYLYEYLPDGSVNSVPLSAISTSAQPTTVINDYFVKEDGRPYFIRSGKTELIPPGAVIQNRSGGMFEAIQEVDHDGHPKVDAQGKPIVRLKRIERRDEYVDAHGGAELRKLANAKIGDFTQAPITTALMVSAGAAIGWGVGSIVKDGLSQFTKSFSHAVVQRPAKTLADKVADWMTTPPLVQKLERIHAQPKEGRAKISEGRIIYGSTRDLIFNPRNQVELAAIRQTYVDALQNGAPLPPLILYGKPGTGKTDYFERLVNDVATEAPGVPFEMFKLTGRQVANAGAKGLTQLFSYLESKKNKVFLIIDECDAMFETKTGYSAKVEDSVTNTSSLTSVLLSAYGVASNKYVILGTTNSPFIQEDAVRSRFPTLRVDLPNARTREQMFLDLFWDKKRGKDAMKTSREDFLAALHQPFTVEELERELVLELRDDEYAQKLNEPGQEDLPEELKTSKLEKVIAYVRKENMINQIVDAHLDKKTGNNKLKSEMFPDLKRAEPKVPQKVENPSAESKLLADLFGKEDDADVSAGLDLVTDAQKEAKLATVDEGKENDASNAKKPAAAKGKEKDKDIKDKEKEKLSPEALAALIEKRTQERQKKYTLIQLSQGLSGRNFALMAGVYLQKIKLANNGEFSRPWLALAILDHLADDYNAKEFTAAREREIMEKNKAIKAMLERERVADAVAKRGAMQDVMDRGGNPFGGGRGFGMGDYPMDMGMGGFGGDMGMGGFGMGYD